LFIWKLEPASKGHQKERLVLIITCTALLVKLSERAGNGGNVSALDRTFAIEARQIGLREEIGLSSPGDALASRTPINEFIRARGDIEK
jgi:hypothetical protein